MLLIYLTSVVVFLLILLVLAQAACVKYYLINLRKSQATSNADDFHPHVTVVLCLRGCDPALDVCLESLLSQDYENYRVVCVLDSEQDPAYSRVKTRSENPRLEIQIAPPDNFNRSLKCNSLVHAFGSIEDPVVVLVDADATVDNQWLAELIAPLKSPHVVASSANRWFLPDARERGSCIRHFWNLAAAPQMFTYQVTWGGSLALKTDFIRESGLLKAWSKALFEDASVRHFAKQAGKQVVMLPALLIPNNESITVAGATRWIERQLLDTKLYHSCFPWVVIHAFSVLITLCSALAVLPALVLGGLYSWVIALGIALGLFFAFYLWAWQQLESQARAALRKRGCRIEGSPPRGITALSAIAATQVIYTLAVVRVLFKKSVIWRGINYRIKSPYDIEMVGYRPMAIKNTKANESI